MLWMTQVSCTWRNLYVLIYTKPCSLFRFRGGKTSCGSLHTKPDRDSQVKRHIKGNAKHFNLTETEQLAWDGFAVVTPDHWKKLIRQVREKVEDHY